MGKAIHWGLCTGKGSELTERWYEDSPESVLEKFNEDWIFCDFMVQTDKVITARRPGLLVLDMEKKNC